MGSLNIRFNDEYPKQTTYRVKFVLTSESQVYVPRIKKLRVMALA